MDKLKRKPVFYVNIALVIMETIALIYDCYSFGFGLFKWYTIDSNVLQLIASCFVLFFLVSLQNTDENWRKNFKPRKDRKIKINSRVYYDSKYNDGIQQDKKY